MIPWTISVYNTIATIFDSASGSGVIAYIKNIESSIYIKDLFINKPIKTKIKMECTFIDKFNKWFPIKRIQ